MRLFTFFKTYYPRELKKSPRFKSKCPTFLEKSLMILENLRRFLGNTAEGGENSPSNVESPMLVEDK